MDEQALPAGPIERVEKLTGGTQNILVRFSRGDREYVLRRGPRHLRPGTNAALLREMQVLAALASTDVPHPRLIAPCRDETVLGGAVFYLMESVAGFNAMERLPALHASDAALRREMGFAAVDALARLGAVDHVAVGLGSLGRPEGFLERQVPRWQKEFESYAMHQGYSGPRIPGLSETADWLRAHCPASFTPGILHGDYHLANLMFALDGPQVAAVVDWEMCTIGDPLLDLGWLLATWPGDDGMNAAAGVLASAGGLPSPDEIVERYAQKAALFGARASTPARDLAAIAWYKVMACFKLGIVLEGTYARALAGKAPMPVGETLHAMTLTLFLRAMRVIETGELA